MQSVWRTLWILIASIFAILYHSSALRLITSDEAVEIYDIPIHGTWFDKREVFQPSTGVFIIFSIFPYFWSRKNRMTGAMLAIWTQEPWRWHVDIELSWFQWEILKTSEQNSQVTFGKSSRKGQNCATIRWEQTETLVFLIQCSKEIEWI